MYALPRRVSRKLFMYAHPCPLYAINRSCFVADGAYFDPTVDPSVADRLDRRSPLARFPIRGNHWSRGDFRVRSRASPDRKPRASDVTELPIHSRQRTIRYFQEYFPSCPADRTSPISLPRKIGKHAGSLWKDGGEKGEKRLRAIAIMRVSDLPIPSEIAICIYIIYNEITDGYSVTTRPRCFCTDCINSAFNAKPSQRDILSLNEKEKKFPGKLAGRSSPVGVCWICITRIWIWIMKNILNLSFARFNM